MNEFLVIEEALNMASKNGAFNLKESAQIAHCVEVTKKNITEYEKIKNTPVQSKDPIEDKPGPSLNKEIDKPVRHK